MVTDNFNELTNAQTERPDNINNFTAFFGQ